MSSPLIPNWSQLGIPIDEKAEAEDAGVEHKVDPEDLDDRED